MDEIAYVAVVQVGGLVVDGAVVSRGFADCQSAVLWARQAVEYAHDGIADVWYSTADFIFQRDTEVSTTRRMVALIRSNDGPTVGFVLSVDHYNGRPL